MEAPLVGELERLGPDGRDALVIGVEAPGFDALSPREKRFAYLMVRAAIPGNAIAFDQSHRDAGDIARLLEACFRPRRAASTPRCATQSTSTSNWSGSTTDRTTTTPTRSSFRRR